jgi:pyruvate formate lyase activating enzyme
VRRNVGGRIVLMAYGHPCAVHVDPIAKKPLYHFLPATRTFSIGTAGCNLRCLNCQNAEISQRGFSKSPSYDLPPRAVAAAALENGCPSVSYTYTEPLIAIEYVRDCAQVCREMGLRNILVTAGYATPETVRVAASVSDAANVDIKSLDDAFYRKVCGVDSAKPVLDALIQFRAAGVWLEVTYLVIPTLNDTDAAFTQVAAWMVANLGAETPLHLSRFFPTHQLTDVPSTPRETLLRARECARTAGLRHVYIGNAEIPGTEDTVCVGCGAVLLRRRSFTVCDNRLQDGQCPACGRAAAGVWR